MVTISSVNTCVHTCRETSPNCAGYLGGIHTVGPPAIAMCAAYVESYRMLKHPELCKVCIHGSCLCAGQASKLVVKVDASEHLELAGAALLPRRDLKKEAMRAKSRTKTRVPWREGVTNPLLL